MDPGEPTHKLQEVSAEQINQPEEPTAINKQRNDLPKQENQIPREKKAIFFRIWFGLKKRELLKVAVGSIAAGISGISKPVFGYFIITIGVAYYKGDSENRVGRYSLYFSSLGILSLFSNTVQHYIFGLIGEKAMINLRQALYEGKITDQIPDSHLITPRESSMTPPW